jgi:uncharacterized protein (DUF1501 family)
MLNRRTLLKTMGMISCGSLARLGSLPLMAQSTGSGYKALVAIALAGGNDGNSILLPMNSSAFAQYANGRGALALSQSNLLPIGSSGVAYGLHPSMAPLQNLYNAGRLSFLANVGNMIKPTTRTSFLNGSVTVPDGLFGHDSQSNEFYAANGNAVATLGWGGLIADQVQNNGGTLPPLFSVAGASVFTKGNTNSSLLLSTPSVGGFLGFDNSTASQARLHAFQAIAASSQNSTLLDAFNFVTQQSIQQIALLQNALQQAAPLKTVFPASDIGNQLKMIAQMISARTYIGATRQVFLCQMGGFDMHSNVLATSSALLADLSASMAAFDAAMLEIGTSQAVTAFTMSEFSRTLQPNTSMGVDHAWGSNHMVMGGAVKGGQVFGTYPSLQLGGPDDAGSIGQWVPTTATVQYGSALANWFGLSASSLNTVFPLLSNFQAGPLSFMR